MFDVKKRDKLDCKPQIWLVTRNNETKNVINVILPSDVKNLTVRDRTSESDLQQIF